MDRKSICKKYNDSHLAQRKAWRDANKEVLKERRRARLKTKKLDLKLTLRRRFNMALKKGYKAGSAVESLGCSIENFKTYLEAKFLPGMNWDNYGRTGWHIDHIKPLNSFDLSDPEHIKVACHYTNLQPLWALDNIRKGHAVP